MADMLARSGLQGFKQNASMPGTGLLSALNINSDVHATARFHPPPPTTRLRKRSSTFTENVSHLESCDSEPQDQAERYKEESRPWANLVSGLCVSC